MRDEVRKAAYPIRDRAQADLTEFLTQSGTKAPRRHTRYGVSVRRTGTVSVEQRVKSKYAPGKPKLRRPKFTDLQLDEFLIPAAEKEHKALDEAMTNTLERLQRKWVTGR